MSDQAAIGARRGVRRAKRATRPPLWRRRRREGGSRALRPRRRRTAGLPGTLGLTLLGAVFPGAGYLYAGRRALGAVVLGIWLALLGSVAWYFGRDVRTSIDLAFDPARLKLAAALLAVGVLVWVFVVLTSYRLVRPRTRPRWHTAVGNTAVGLLCLAVLVPGAMASRYALAQADLVKTVFDGNASATRPGGVSEKDPWGGRRRVNVLLLGGDAGEGRTGVRTDTVILVSMDTRTGKTVMFSLPRNMMYAQFPESSPLHDLYPDGYGVGTAESEAGFYMLNAVYGQIPERHPGVLGESDNEGADAIKQAVAGSLGVRVDYYLLANLSGFKQVVDAMGGVTVNINEPVAIEGNTDAGIPPIGYLEPGPDQHLDGYHALWFARGRWGSDDYERMERQRCMVDAIVEAADPVTLLTRYLDLAKAGKEVVYTDIPLDIAPAFVELALEVKKAKVKSVVFKSSDKFFSGDPDYDYLHETVQRALHPKPKPGRPAPPKADKPDQDTEDACAYHPEDETVSASSGG
ncbi:LCP family protein [Nocardioides sp. cx-169]|uniref:LCP family protein n=1 Tax=Nocardioides sp. cx-169 TaxID=2899080 RepID=UPI001E56725F|nr:LCP family protein [Nocardioides sp. cx-169]MCD4534576.1 LCP family protein [Nocardioides sp. cx-169]